MAVITDIAEAVKDELNAGSFSQPFTAERHYRPLFELPEMKIESRMLECEECENACEVTEVRADGRSCAHLGDRCGRQWGSRPLRLTRRPGRPLWRRQSLL